MFDPPAVPVDAVRNQILRHLGSRELQLLLPRLERVELAVMQTVHDAGRPIEHTWFIEAGTVSMLAAMADGSQAEVGLIGREGMVGLSLVLGNRTAHLDAMVQVEGVAWRIGAGAFREALDGVPGLAGAILRYVDLFHFQVAQTAACNSRHPIRRRLARWILMTADRVEGDRFAMTQDFMARMLGVLRPSVNIAVQDLQRSGAISHRQTVLRVLDRSALEAASCECYRAVRDPFAAWAGDAAGTGSGSRAGGTT